MQQYRILLLLVLFSILLFSACKWLGKGEKPTTVSIKDKSKTDMPIPALPTLTGDYPEDWAVVDSLEEQGLYKSALETVEKIEVKAKGAQNSPQVVKCTIFRAKYNAQLEEDGFPKGLNIFESAITNSTNAVEKAVLQSLCADLYGQYLSNNGWNLQERTPVTDEGGDILTWSAAQIQKRALLLYAASVEPKTILLEQTAAAYKDILIPGKGDSISNEALRPGLYDLLCHRAIAYFSNESSYLSEPTYAFEITQPEAFSKRENFVLFNFESKDLTSGKWLALKTFQQVLQAQGAALKPNVGALVDADLARLKFVLAASPLENKQELYATALQDLRKACTGHPSESEILYELAIQLQHRDLPADKIKNDMAAVALLEEGKRLHPNSYGAQLCEQQLNSIRRASLNCSVEQVNYPNAPILFLLKYRNLDQVWVKVLKQSKDKSWQNNPLDKQIEILNQIKSVQNREWNWKSPADYQEHSTELSLKGLAAGEYHLLISSNAAFDVHKGPVILSHFSTSRIAMTNISPQGAENRFVTVDRNSGEPLPGVKIEMFQQDWRSGKYELNLVGQTTSDKNGMAQYPVPPQINVMLRASLEGDSLWSGNAYNYQMEETRDQNRVHFFTDRGIYRPGQSVYFKGIYYKMDGAGKPSILPNKTVQVKLMDVNGQEKGSLELRSNEYGTFNGVFTAPIGGLTGQMSIREENSGDATYFNVEEYKRPKFEVTLKPIEGNYRVGDQLIVKGIAQNYAGNAVDDAAVTYSVVRVARFPYFDYWSYGKRPAYSRTERQIAFGTVKTDVNGNFEVSFKAEPDLSIPKKDQPVFDYAINVDVTDISGETQNAVSNVSAAYTAIRVQWDLPDEIQVDSLRKVPISASNFAGQPQKVRGNIEFQMLVEPKKQYIKRLWENPDIQAIPKAEFTENFPLFAYNNEDKPEKWDRQDFLIPFEFNTEKGKTVDLNGGKVQPGYYVAVLETQDAFGEKVRIEKIVRVYNSSNRYLLPSIEIAKTSYEPGEIAKISFGSNQPQRFFYAIERKYKLDLQFADAKNTHVLDIPIKEDDRGGLGLYWFAVRNNRYFGGYGGAQINVPWSNKDLNIRYETFRDKLAPGQKEEWRIRISGPKKDKVAAEMVATMYDASLDQFQPNEWGEIFWPDYYGGNVQWDNGNTFNLQSDHGWFLGDNAAPGIYRSYPAVNWFDFPFGGRYMLRSKMMAMDMAAPMSVGSVPPPPPPSPEGAGGGVEESLKKLEGVVINGSGTYADGIKVSGVPPSVSDAEGMAKAPPASLRTNLKETVFFFPDLHTDANGDILVKFTMNEALTRWKFMAFAHTKNLEQVLSTKEVLTQKELMVLPNTPRFLRAGDAFEFSTKVSNLSQSALSGTVSLLLMDAATLQPMNDKFGLNTVTAVQKFSAAPGQSAPATWMVKVPDDFSGALTWRIFAESGSFRDGEESTLPVVTNRMLVTETLPISLRGNQTKTFRFDNMKDASSNSLRNQNYSIEFSSNPVWYAVQALPYLMEYPHECSEQMFSRFYANTLAASVTEKMPGIKRIYERWKGTDAMKSNLSKNQELKYALLEETPWVMAAQSEEQQKQQIALLFDLNRMANEREKAIRTLAERQYPTGGWPWFPGGEASWSITQHILCGFKHLEKLGAFDAGQDQEAGQMVNRASDYCYDQMLKTYKKLEEEAQAGRTKMEDDHLDGLIIQFLYAASFQKIDRPSKEMAYYYGQAEKYWLGKGLHQEGMIALALHRSGRIEAAQRIVKSLKERATIKEELGMYWPVQWGYNWYQLPVETQAMMVEVFQDVTQDTRAVEDLRIWLLKNKQTNRWESTKATAEAVYALLLSDGKTNPWIENTKPVQVTLGNKTLKPKEYEAGTGYFKQSWAGSEVKSSWADIKVENPNSNIVWGAAYWQYFEDLDKIKNFQKTPLTIIKQLFTEENTANGPLLTPVAEGQSLKRGSKLKVRIEIRVDRPMEFVHLKDMRAAGFEPRNVLSGYRYQGGLGYYESTKDLATNFFIDYLPRGTFVFEYPLVVSHRGDMSNGITTMQCMYAPEFTSHSKGIRVKVE